MDVWWTRAKSLRTGSAETRCLSCHTAVPYALVRAALRRADAVTTPTGHEERLLDTVRRRLESTSADQPYYDHTDAKKAESRGVEAVLNALVVTALDRGPGATALARTAMSRLWAAQRSDGAWDWLDFGLEPYETPEAVFHGATLAALAVGSPLGRAVNDDENGREGVERLRGYLRSSMASQRLFNVTWMLLASTRVDGVLSAAERDAVMRRLQSRQRPDGGWSLNDFGTWRWGKTDAPFAPPGTIDQGLVAGSDAYATGLAVYAMRQAGAGTASRSIRDGQAWLRAHQTPERPGDPGWAPWRAHSLNFDREHGGDKGEPWRRLFMSDLATAFAALALL
jgi:hypothetical protein